MRTSQFQPKSEDGQPIWRRDDGSIVACTEKIKVMREALADLRQVAQDALEDALLMGVTEMQVRQAFHHLIDDLDNSYSKNKSYHATAEDGQHAIIPQPTDI